MANGTFRSTAQTKINPTAANAAIHVFRPAAIATPMAMSAAPLNHAHTSRPGTPSRHAGASPAASAEQRGAAQPCPHEPPRDSFRPRGRAAGNEVAEEELLYAERGEARREEEASDRRELVPGVAV